MELRTLTFAALALAAPVAAAQAQPVSGFYIGAGAGGNFMQDEHVGSTGRVGAYTSTTTPFTVGTTTYGGTTTIPASSYSSRRSLGLDPGGVVVLNAGYGLGNGLRVEVEADYRVNGFSRSRGEEQKFGGMLNVLYDLPVSLLGATPYAGVGAGYMWADRRPSFDRTDSFAYQAILGASLPIRFVPGLSATLEYRFMGLAGAAHRYVTPGFASSSAGFSAVQEASPGTTKYNDDFNHGVLVGLRYAFNAAPPPVAGVVHVPPVPVSHDATYLVFFDWDRTELTARARQIIAEAARASQAVQTTRILVSGHADRSGTARYNQALSLRRADAVAAELVRDGVPRSMVQAQGYGESHPLVPTADGVREPQNRRVEIVMQ